MPVTCSPAQKHRERHEGRTLAQAASEAARQGVPVEMTRYDTWLVKLASDRRRLKGIQSIELKQEVKKEILPDYAEYVRGAIEADLGVSDEVLMSVMVWRIDAGDYRGGLEIAEYAIRHRLAMPDRYQRTAGCLVAEEIAEAALKAFDADRDFDAAVLVDTADLTKLEDMPDEVRAKLHKAIGYATREDAPTTALVHLRRALELYGKVGVKKDIERLERSIDKMQPMAAN